MKKILIFHPFGGLGGAGLSLLHIVRSIDKSKYRVIVITPAQPPDISLMLENEECMVVRSQTSPVVLAYYSGGISFALSPRSILNILRVFRDRTRVSEYIRKLEPDIVVMNSITLAWIAPIAKYFGKATVCFVRETFQGGIFGLRKAFLLYLLSKWVDSVAFISKYDRNIAKQINSRKYIIHDRVDTKLYSQLGKSEALDLLRLSPSRKYILYVSGLANIKGSHVVMDAMRQIKTPHVSLICLVANTDTTMPNWRTCHSLLEKAIVALGFDARVRTLRIFHKYQLSDRVIFRKFTQAPEQYYAACDAIVFPSTKPHQARPVFEAGVAGIPVIITDFPQTSEFAVDGKTAFVFPCGNSRKLAQILDKILSGEIKITEVVQANYTRSLRDHDLSTLPDEISVLLGELVTPLKVSR